MFKNGLENPKFYEKEGDGAGEQLTDKEKHDAHLLQAMKERDEAKAKAKKAEEFETKAIALEKKLKDIEDAKLTEAGEFQKLADGYKKQIEELTPEVDRLKSIETIHNEYIANRKKSIIDSFPEDKRDEWKDADLKTLEKVAPLFNAEQILGSDNGRSGKSLITTGQKFDDFNNDELDKIKKDNPKEYERLFREKYGNAKQVI